MRPTALRAHIRTLAALASLVAALVVVGGAPSAQAAPQGHRVCAPVVATGIGQDLGPDAQGVLHTTATLRSGPVVLGTTYASFTPGTLAGSTLTFSGPIVFTPSVGRGTVTAQVQGSVDLATGQFTATSTSVSGTGPLAGVTGALTFAGTEDLATGAFTETVTGTLCAGRPS